MKRISTEAYQALREALAVIIWNKRPFESYLRTALRDHPELLAGLNFNEPKRVVADELVGRLASQEARYQSATLDLMLEVASMTTFTNIEQIREPADRALRLAEAQGAVAALAGLVEHYASHRNDRERAEAETEASRAMDAALRRFNDDVAALQTRFLDLHVSPDVHERGRALERLLTDLFCLFDMEPRLSYSLEREQIDGSLSFDTDDYIVEARWRQQSVSRADADVLAAKVRRKGKNALGLFVSITGFTEDARTEYSHSTPFIAMDGTDLFAVLDQRVRLDDLLKAKRRHANETGECYMPASSISP